MARATIHKCSRKYEKLLCRIDKKQSPARARFNLTRLHAKTAKNKKQEI